MIADEPPTVDAPVGEAQFDDFLQQLSDAEEERQLPILVSGYNPASPADMTELFTDEDGRNDEDATALGRDEAGN